MDQIRFFRCADFEENGIPIQVYFDEGIKKTEKFIIPEPNQIFDFFIRILLNSGFSNVVRTNRKKSNCVIRVFWKEHFYYEDFNLNFYGAEIYTRPYGNNIDRVIEFRTKIWLYQDDSVLISPNYQDFYVRII